MPIQRVRIAFRLAIGALWIAFLECLTPLVAVGLAPLFYWRLLVGDTRDAATLPSGDISDLHYPYRRWVAEQLARGIQPWWNEFVSGGHSAIGDIQFHTLYPPDQWLAQWSGGASPIVTLELGIIGHVALAALFTYLLVRRLSGSRIGGLVGAVVFAFGGYLSGFPVQQMIILETSIWLPLVLLAVDVGADYSLLTAFVLGAGGVALAALAGHPQTLFYVLLAAALYGLFKTWRRGRVQPVVPVGMAILGLGGLALAAAALFPAFAHLALTDRTDVTFDFSRGGFQLHEALGLILPIGFGGAALYHGVASLLLVAVALTSPFRRSNKLFWLALGIIGLLVSFGSNTFLQGPIYLALGSFKFRNYERTSFYVAMAVAVLAGYGAAELTRFRPPRLDWLSRGLPVLFGAVAVALTLIVVLSTTTAQNNSQAINSLLNQTIFSSLILSLASAIVYARWRRLLRPGNRWSPDRVGCRDGPFLGELAEQPGARRPEPVPGQLADRVLSRRLYERAVSDLQRRPPAGGWQRRDARSARGHRRQLATGNQGVPRLRSDRPGDHALADPRRPLRDHQAQTGPSADSLAPPGRRDQPL